MNNMITQNERKYLDVSALVLFNAESILVLVAIHSMADMRKTRVTVARTWNVT
jgi:hypothetical protein